MAKYTPRDLVAQALVAFGQGTGCMRVSHDATRALIERYEPWVEKKKLITSWETDGVQILERVRAVGRLVAIQASSEGRTAINAEDVVNAMPRVERASATEICGDNF